LIDASRFTLITRILRCRHSSLAAAADATAFVFAADISRLMPPDTPLLPPRHFTPPPDAMLLIPPEITPDAYAATLTLYSPLPPAFRRYFAIAR